MILTGMQKLFRKSRGFSLVELLLTVALVALLSLSFLALTSTLLNRGDRLKKGIVALHLAQSGIEQALFQNRAQGLTFISSKNFPDEILIRQNTRFFRFFTIETLNPHLKSLQVIVSWDGGQKELKILLGDWF